MTEGALSRRDFLRLSGRVGLGALAVTIPGAMPLWGAQRAKTPAFASARPQAVDEPAREFVLEAQEFDWELAPGLVVKAMGYNGRTPGPAIRAKHGDIIRIYAENALPKQSMSIHWHGLDEASPMLMDAEASEDTPHTIPDVPFSSEGEFIYEFEMRPTGTRFLHPSHTWPGVVQMDSGLYAPVIIDPDGPEPFPYDREYTLCFDDWATGTRPPLPGTWDGTAVGGVGGGMAMGMGTMMGAMMRGPRTMPYDIMTINSKAYPLTKPLRVRRGERVRLRLINPSNWLTHVIRLTGHPLKVTHTDGNPLIAPVEVDALPITVSERYDVLFEANQPGVWFLYCTQPGHAAAGEKVLVVYDGHEVSTPPPPVPGTAGLRVWHYALGRGQDIIPAPTGQVRNYRMTLMGQPMTDTWTINGLNYPKAYDKQVANVGDLVRVQITNMSMIHHPMHLHGQSHKVLAVNGVRLANPIVKDVTDVHPMMGTIFVEFTAQYPGKWPYHCHLWPHSEGGMFTYVEIT